jgi:Ethanolamine utilization protein EutJ (predicted chaperonin)
LQRREILMIEVPPEIVKAVKLIEKWATKQTMRDDWAIGGICCRKGAERLKRELEKLKNK